MNSVTYDGDGHVGTDIKGVFEMYIFNLENFMIHQNRVPVLRGIARPYKLHDDRVGEPLEKKLVLSMEEKPTYKTRGAICCL